MNKIDILIKGDKFSDFISKLEDLAKINDVVRIQINNEDIYIYSVIGDPIIQAFKNFILKTDDYFDIKLDDDKTLELTISDIKKFIKKTNFIDISLNPKMSLHIKEDDDYLKMRYLEIKSGKFKLQSKASDDIKDITRQMLSKVTDKKNKRWSFNLDKGTFQSIKKLSNISSDSKVIDVSINKGKIIMSEVSNWELEIDDIDSDNKNFLFDKKYLSCINEMENIEFNIFDTFILIEDRGSNLMISYEQDFAD